MHRTNHPPLVILGIDAGDPTFIHNWVREGLLPNIKSIMDRGCFGKTAGAEMISEHAVWLSLFGGISRADHGCYYFRQLKPGTYDLVPITGHDLDAPPFWKTLVGGKRVVAIDIPDVLPIKGLDGIQLANWAVHLGWVTNDPVHAPRAEPEGFFEEAARVFGERIAIVENSVATVEEDRVIFRNLMQQLEQRGKLLRHTVKQAGRADVIATVLAETHTGTHQFWKYRDPSKNNDPELAGAIRDLYVATDREIGLLLKEVPNANVVIVTSVGIGDFQPTSGLVEDFCRKLGYQASPPPAKFSLHPLSLARRILPEWVRVMLSKGLPRETRERLLADQFRNSTDWSKTTAFAIPSFYSSFIRVNLKGREPNGIVNPGAEYDDVLKRLEADVRALIDPKTGQSPVQIVLRAGAIDPTLKPPKVLPDLFIVWKQHRRLLDRLDHPRATITQKPPEWLRDSDHVREGFFAFAGPDIPARGEIGDQEILNLAPTFMSLIGAPQPPRMKGKPIVGVLREAGAVPVA